MKDHQNNNDPIWQEGSQQSIVGASEYCNLPNVAACRQQPKMTAEAPGKILMECMASWVTWVSQMTSIKGDWAAVSFQPRPTFDLEVDNILHFKST